MSNINLVKYINKYIT